MKFGRFVLAGLVILLIVCLASFIPLSTIAQNISSTVQQVIILSSLPIGAPVDSTVRQVIINSGNATGVSATYNNNATGTTLNRLACTAVVTAVQDCSGGATQGVQGITVAGAGTSGTAKVQTTGVANCTFSGGITYGDYAQVDASTSKCVDGGASYPTTGGEVVGTIVSATNGSAGLYSVNLFGADVANTGGGTGSVNAPTEAGNTGYYASTAKKISGVAHEIHAGSGTLAAALASVPQTVWVQSTPYTSAYLVYDSITNTTQFETVASCTSGSGSPPVFSATIGNTVSDNTCTWKTIALGAGAPSVNNRIILDPNTTYTVNEATLIAPNAPAGVQTTLVLNNNTNIVCGDTGGAGHACLVVGHPGHIMGQGTGSGSVATSSTANIDSLIESFTGYMSSRFGISIVTTDMEVQDIGTSVAPTATLQKGVLWIAGIDGQGTFKDLIISGGDSAGKPEILIDDTVHGWSVLRFDNVGVSMHGSTTGVDVECGTRGGGNLVWTGGGIVDPSSSTPTWLKLNGSGSFPCISVTVQGLYVESSASVAGNGDFLLANGVAELNVAGMVFSGGPATANCIHITGANTNGNMHFDGRALGGVCTDSINNTASTPNYVSTATGNFSYDYTNGGDAGTAPVRQVGGLAGDAPHIWTTGINLTGVDTESLVTGFQKFTLTANESLTLNSGTLAPTASATLRYPFEFEICQGSPGNFTLAFSGVQWSGGAQPGYTLTNGNADFYRCRWDNVNLDCKEEFSNVPC